MWSGLLLGAGACQPATFRTGAGACQPGTVVTWLDDDGDVAGALEDAARAAFGPRPDPAHRDALVHKGPRDEQIITLEVAGPLGVRGRARDDLVDGLTGGLGANLRVSRASETSRPRTRSTTRRTLVGETRTCRAIAYEPGRSPSSACRRLGRESLLMVIRSFSASAAAPAARSDRCGDSSTN